MGTVSTVKVKSSSGNIRTDGQTQNTTDCITLPADILGEYGHTLLQQGRRIFATVTEATGDIAAAAQIHSL